MPDAAPRVCDLLTRGAARLRQSGIDTPELDAAVLLAHVLGITRAALYARSFDPVMQVTQTAYAVMLDQRAANVPVAYLTGTKEFMGLPFAVSPAVLVPRPETELLIEWAIAWLVSRGQSATVVDVGTGSGAVAVSVAKLAALPSVIASDISLTALRVARSNARMHVVEDCVHLVCGDLLAWLGRSVDLILVNLPYLTDQQADAPELTAEPRNALIGGEDDGFALYRSLLPQVAARLNPSGALAFEIDPAQELAAAALCEATFSTARVAIHQDLAGMARFLTVETAAS